jgi:PAB-dependent poly(A)-specific ribonuclease subunit 2
MLECCQGVNCQASNFLRAFGLIPQGFSSLNTARALGLLVLDPETASFARLIQTSCRFILEQIQAEMSDPLISTLVGIHLNSTSTCDADHSFVREIVPFVIDLTYNHSKKSKTFVDVLKGSINKVTTSKAWCGLCNSYTPSKQTKSLASPPNFMCINANINTDSERALWSETDWLPLSFAIILGENKFEILNADADFSQYSDKVEIYDLRATIAEVKSESKGHLVGHLNGLYIYSNYL